MLRTGEAMKIYYIYSNLKDPTHIVFEGTAKQLHEELGFVFFNDYSLREFVKSNGWHMSIFSDVPTDYYENERNYNHKGIVVGYTMFNSRKIGY